MAILFSDNSYRADKIFSLLSENMSGVDLRRYPDIGNPSEIEYAIMFRPAPGSLQNLPNLKAIFMTSAGVDSIMHDETLPDVPIVRNTDTHLANGIRDYVIYHVLHYHRFFNRYNEQQKTATWKQYPQFDTSTKTIGIMGLGEMSTPTAKALTSLGFKIRAWSRTEKQEENITCFHGKEQLKDFLSGTEILVNILPLTDETKGILNTELFAQLPKNAVVINVGRGSHLIEQDLIDALNNDHLAAATLDVFAEEPLAENNPLWSHPKIKITPHIASLTDLKNVSTSILSLIADNQNGIPFKNVVDRKRQY